ncbi:response regulator [Geobacter sp. SVR]|uniref:response regulator n=1 Tax=Geobacter sp. SVR TaxID=2495594 RepID=UPI00143EFD9E|nr:response regulator [Geobacter sp. SVR]BCS52242.1 response regulator [Geobacter sp. SVR]GCF85097.1 response regulator [Geobacter sp. SVR]
MQHEEKSVEILLVEDNPADVHLLQEAFQESRIANHLSVVKDGELAMDFLYHRGEYAAVPRPDLVLLDIGLPKKSGLEVLAEIKDDPGLRRIPVIMLTTSKAEADILMSYDLHANSFITKPVHLHELFEVVRQIEEFWFEIVKLPPR